MFRYTFSGTGRKVGAIGIMHPFVAKVCANNDKEAMLKLYEQYEHISNLQKLYVQLVDDNGTEN